MTSQLPSPTPPNSWVGQPQRRPLRCLVCTYCGSGHRGAILHLIIFERQKARLGKGHGPVMEARYDLSSRRPRDFNDSQSLTRPPTIQANPELGSIEYHVLLKTSITRSWKTVPAIATVWLTVVEENYPPVVQLSSRPKRRV
jgi:hypothetical protein